ncbi:ribosomal protein L16, partial [Acinetobacter baumannii]|uniref:ribosomal protein L16 n=1 Tax=Acinetobacter baumannii TaxID=470 RepID=UPI000A88C9E6
DNNRFVHFVAYYFAGNVEYWVCEIKPGKILYEIEGVNEDLAREAFALAAAKLPFKTTIVTRTVM